MKIKWERSTRALEWWKISKDVLQCVRGCLSIHTYTRRPRILQLCCRCRTGIRLWIAHEQTLPSRLHDSRGRRVYASFPRYSTRIVSTCDPEHYLSSSLGVGDATHPLNFSRHILRRFLCVKVPRPFRELRQQTKTGQKKQWRKVNVT